MMITKSPFLLSLRDVIRVKRYSLQTEKSYLYWAKYFIMFNDKRHPKDLGLSEINHFLTFLAVKCSNAKSSFVCDSFHVQASIRTPIR